MAARVARECPVCREEYQADPGRLAHGRQTTCSRECSYAFRGRKSSVTKTGRPSPLRGVKRGPEPWNRKERVVQPCANCGEDMELVPWQVRQGQRFCSKPCAYAGRECKATFQPGHPAFYRNPGHSEETKAKMRQVNRANARRGPDNPNWRGGMRTERSRAMQSYEYRDWRTSVFERDDYTCQKCSARGGVLHADHIVGWADDESLRYDVDNGRTLCVPCHYEVTFGRPMAPGVKWCNVVGGESDFR